MPLNEKSGLNLPGQFNIGNLTTFEQEKVIFNRELIYNFKPEKIEENEENDMEVGEIREEKFV